MLFHDSFIRSYLPRPSTIQSLFNHLFHVLRLYFFFSLFLIVSLAASLGVLPVLVLWSLLPLFLTGVFVLIRESARYTIYRAHPPSPSILAPMPWPRARVMSEVDNNLSRSPITCSETPCDTTPTPPEAPQDLDTNQRRWLATQLPISSSRVGALGTEPLPALFPCFPWNTFHPLNQRCQSVYQLFVALRLISPCTYMQSSANNIPMQNVNFTF